MKYDEIKIGQKVVKDVDIYQSDVDNFIAITRDTNSVHMGKEGIVHGMLVASFISTMIGMHLPGSGAIWVSHKISFIKPVFVNDNLEITAKVISKDALNIRVKIDVNITNQKNELVLCSSSWVKVPE